MLNIILNIIFLNFSSVLYSIKLTFIICKIAQLRNNFFHKFLSFLDRGKRKATVFLSSNNHCGIMGRTFSSLEVSILLAHFLGKLAETYLKNTHYVS